MNDDLRSPPGRLVLHAESAATATSDVSRLAEATARPVTYDAHIHETGTRPYRLGTSETSRQASPPNVYFADLTGHSCTSVRLPTMLWSC
jgi:hypothetical protein